MTKLLVYILLVLTVVSCDNRKKSLIERNEAKQDNVDTVLCGMTCVISESLADLIRKETADETKTNFWRESRVVYLRFYQLKEKNYLILNTAPGYSNDIEGFCVFEDKLLVIDCVNGASRMFINFEIRDIAEIPEIYNEMLDEPYSPKHSPKHYKLLSETEFVEFQPDRQHRWELFNLLADEDKMLRVPPLPDGTQLTREEEFNMIESWSRN